MAVGVFVGVKVLQPHGRAHQSAGGTAAKAVAKTQLQQGATPCSSTRRTGAGTSSRCSGWLATGCQRRCSSRCEVMPTISKASTARASASVPATCSSVSNAQPGQFSAMLSLRR